MLSAMMDNVASSTSTSTSSTSNNKNTLQSFHSLVNPMLLNDDHELLQLSKGHDVEALTQHLSAISPSRVRIYINSVDKYSNTALFHAIDAYDANDSNQQSRMPIVRTLLQFGSDVNHQNNDNSTPLHLACASKQYEVIILLLAYDANPHSPNIRGFRCYELVADRVERASIEALVRSCLNEARKGAESKEASEAVPTTKGAAEALPANDSSLRHTSKKSGIAFVPVRQQKANFTFINNVVKNALTLSSTMPMTPTSRQRSNLMKSYDSLLMKISNSIDTRERSLLESKQRRLICRSKLTADPVLAIDIKAALEKQQIELRKYREQEAKRSQRREKAKSAQSAVLGQLEQLASGQRCSELQSLMAQCFLSKALGTTQRALSKMFVYFAHAVIAHEAEVAYHQMKKTQEKAQSQNVFLTEVKVQEPETNDLDEMTLFQSPSNEAITNIALRYNDVVIQSTTLKYLESVLIQLKRLLPTPHSLSTTNLRSSNTTQSNSIASSNHCKAQSMSTSPGDKNGATSRQDHECKDEWRVLEWNATSPETIQELNSRNKLLMTYEQCSEHCNKVQARDNDNHEAAAYLSALIMTRVRSQLRCERSDLSSAVYSNTLGIAEEIQTRDLFNTRRVEINHPHPTLTLPLAAKALRAKFGRDHVAEEKEAHSDGNAGKTIAILPTINSTRCLLV